MSVSGVKVLDADFACDVYDDFFDRYDAGGEPDAIRAELADAYETEIFSAADREFFLTALADALWEVGAPVDDLRGSIAAMLAADETAGFWDDLYPARKKALARFLTKLGTPKKTPRRRQKARRPAKLPFVAGDYLAFAKRNGAVVPVIVWMVETHAPLRYDFVFPNLSRAGDPEAAERFLDASVPLTDDELEVFFSPDRKAKVVTLEHRDLKPHLGRFRRFGNRPFAHPPWRGSSFGYIFRIEDFERRADEAGSRSLTPDELARLGVAFDPV